LKSFSSFQQALLCPLNTHSRMTLDEALSQPLVPYIRKGYSDYHHWLSGVLKRARRKPRLGHRSGWSHQPDRRC
jgi:hypothetical protein